MCFRAAGQPFLRIRYLVLIISRRTSGPRVWRLLAASSSSAAREARAERCLSVEISLAACPIDCYIPSFSLLHCLTFKPSNEKVQITRVHGIGQGKKIFSTSLYWIPVILSAWSIERPDLSSNYNDDIISIPSARNSYIPPSACCYNVRINRKQRENTYQQVFHPLIAFRAKRWNEFETRGWIGSIFNSTRFWASFRVFAIGICSGTKFSNLLFFYFLIRYCAVGCFSKWAEFTEIIDGNATRNVVGHIKTFAVAKSASDLNEVNDILVNKPIAKVLRWTCSADAKSYKNYFLCNSGRLFS